MGKMKRIIVTIIIAMFLSMSFNNIVFADVTMYTVKEDKHMATFHDAEHVAKRLEKYGYKGTPNISKDKDTQRINWGMEANIKILVEESGVEKGVPIYKYEVTINGKNAGDCPWTESRNSVENGAKGRLQEKGYNYNGKLSIGDNKIKWNASAEIKISEWNKDGTEFKYSYKIQIIDLNNSTIADEDKYETGVVFDEKNAKDMNGVERYVKPGSDYYSYEKSSSGIKSFVSRGELTGRDSVYVIKKDESSGWSKIELKDGTECYIKNDNLLKDQAPIKDIEAVEQQQQQDQDALSEILGEDYFNFDPYPGGVYMEDLGGSTIADPTNTTEVNEYNPYNSGSNLTEANSLKILNLGKTVIGILNVIATVVAVLVLTILGIKYMMGSIEEKAEYKETMMPYLIGAIFIFSSTTIVNLIYNFAMAFNK